MLQSYGFTIWKTEGGDDKKPPKGFEKFFKKKEEGQKEGSQATKGKSLTKSLFRFNMNSLI